MDAPPVLTAERIDAMLSVMAEVCLESVVEGGRRQKAAEDFEAFERSGRTLQRACRNLRQTIAMKQRFDREEARKADDARKAACAARQGAEQARQVAVARRRARVQAHFSQVLWNEYEADDAEELFDEVGMRLRDLSFDDDFLETPVETLIQRLSDEIGLGEAPEAGVAEKPSPPCGERVGSGGVDAEPAAKHPHPRPLPARGRGEVPEVSASSAIPAVEPDRVEAATPPPPPDPPPEPPPDPPPEPYVPPWERLAPGQRLPGGSGW